MSESTACDAGQRLSMELVKAGDERFLVRPGGVSPSLALMRGRAWRRSLERPSGRTVVTWSALEVSPWKEVCCTREAEGPHRNRRGPLTCNLTVGLTGSEPAASSSRTPRGGSLSAAQTRPVWLLITASWSRPRVAAAGGGHRPHRLAPPATSGHAGSRLLCR